MRTVVDRNGLPVFTDLRALADELARRGDTKLRAQVTQAWRVQSCLGDLRQAMDCVVALKNLINRPTGEESNTLSASERALMTTAILLYARATSTGGNTGERGSIQLDKEKLTPEEWNDHTVIVDVRNQAMAHVYSSRPLDDHEWHRAVFFAVHIGEIAGRHVWKAASATNQTSFRRATLDRLERALPTAHREMKAKFQKRMDAVSKTINEELKGEALFKHVFDPVPSFGSVAAVEAVLGGAPDGEASFWFSETERQSG